MYTPTMVGGFLTTLFSSFFVPLPLTSSSSLSGAILSRGTSHLFLVHLPFFFVSCLPVLLLHRLVPAFGSCVTFRFFTSKLPLSTMMASPASLVGACRGSAVLARATAARLFTSRTFGGSVSALNRTSSFSFSRATLSPGVSSLSRAAASLSLPGRDASTPVLSRCLR